MAEIKVEKRVERARYKPGRLGKSAEFAKYSRWNIKNTNLKANVWPEDATCTDDCKVSSSAKNRSICNLELASSKFEDLVSEESHKLTVTSCTIG